MAEKEEPPDWEQFEVYKGEEPGPPRPAWLDRLLHCALLSLFLIIAFGIGGAFFFLMSYQKRHLVSNHAMRETESSAWVKFIIGGVAADVVVLGWMFGKSR